MNIIDDIHRLVNKYKVPSRLTADWEFTNHYELTDEHGRLWLDVEDALALLPDGQIALSDQNEAGRRLGFCLEAAELVAKYGYLYHWRKSWIKERS